MKTDELENIVLKPPFYSKITKAFVPFLAAAVVFGTVFLFIISPESSLQGFFKNGLMRILISVFIFAVSIIPFFKKNYYIITSHKIMQFNKWELDFKDIKTVDIHKKYLKKTIEITPKQNPELKFTVNQWDIDRKIDEVAKELSFRIKNINGVK